MVDSSDRIEIRRLQLSTHIGVPDEERSSPQTLWATVVMHPSQGFDALNDNIHHTIDYYAISQEILALASSKPRNLIETLAVEIANHLLSHHPISSVSVSIEKQILPNTDCVAVHIQRSRL